MFFLIIGCGRSGTKFVSELLTSNGILVGHELKKQDGLSCWGLTPLDLSYNVPWGPDWKEFISDLDERPLILHQVRNPIDVISSCHTFHPDSWKYISKYIPLNTKDSTLLKCMKYWYYWNLLASKNACLTYRIEYLVEDWRKASLEKLDLILSFLNTNATKQNVNTRKRYPDYKVVNIDQMKSQDLKLANNILSLAKSYGYII